MSDNYLRKLSPAQVEDIVQGVRNGAVQAHLAQRHGVSPQAITKVVKKHLPGFLPALKHERDVVTVDWQGHSVAMYRDPNSGDMRFAITVPEGYEDLVGVEINDDRMIRE